MAFFILENWIKTVKIKRACHFWASSDKKLKSNFYDARLDAW